MERMKRFFNNELSKRNEKTCILSFCFLRFVRCRKKWRAMPTFFLLLSLDSLFASNCNMEKCLTVLPLI